MSAVPPKKATVMRMSRSTVTERLIGGGEDDRVGDRHDALLGRREADAVEGPRHAGDDAAVGQIRSAVRGAPDRAVAPDDEPHRDAPLEARVAAQPSLV